MAKRNAKKQATREEIESTDPVCRELTVLLDRADLLILTQGADYDTEDADAREYDKRLAYLTVLLTELVDYRVTLVLREEMPSSPTSTSEIDTDPNLKQPQGPTAHEGSSDGDTNDTETERE